MRDERAIFEFFRQSASSPELAGLAYAAYAFSKFEWIDRQHEVNGRPPSACEISGWIAGLPDSTLESLVNQATDLFDGAARIYLAPETGREIERATRRAITVEIKRSNRQVQRRVERATSYWRQFIPNVMNGIVASVIFVIVVAGGAWIFDSDPSPFAALKHFLYSAPGSK